MAGVSEGLGREIVLALLVERAGSAYELDQRLRRRFPNSDYARDTARKSLKRLHADGLAVPADPSRSRRRSRALIWEATSAGVEQARKWVGDYIDKPPLREELYAKIVLCDAESVPRLLDVAREAERMCELELERLEERSRSVGPSAGGVLGTGAVEKAWWDARARFFQSVRRHLEIEREQMTADKGPVLETRPLRQKRLKAEPRAAVAADRVATS